MQVHVPAFVLMKWIQRELKGISERLKMIKGEEG